MNCLLPHYTAVAPAITKKGFGSDQRRWFFTECHFEFKKILLLINTGKELCENAIRYSIDYMHNLLNFTLQTLKFESSNLVDKSKKEVQMQNRHCRRKSSVV